MFIPCVLLAHVSGLCSLEHKDIIDLMYNLVGQRAEILRGLNNSYVQGASSMGSGT